MEEALKSIEKDLEIINKAADNGLRGNLTLEYDFKNEMEHDAVMTELAKNYDRYKFSIQIEGICVLIVGN